MHKNTELSDLEYKLMTFFWNQKNPVSFAEILNFCNEEQHWNWAKTTAHTYLTRLMEKNLVDVNHVAGKRRTYFAKITQDSFSRQAAQEFVDSSFSGSIKNLLLALVPNYTISQSDAEELHKILDSLTETNDSSQK